MRVREPNVKLHITGERASYQEAHRSARERRAKLPLHVHMDDMLLDRHLHGPEGVSDIELWEMIARRRYNTGWACEMVTHPNPGEAFTRGRDILDSYSGHFGWSHMVPASSMPSEVFGKKGIAVAFEPLEFTVRGEHIVIETDPGRVTIAERFPQRSGIGVVHEATRLPQLVDELADFGTESLRAIRRLPAQAIRPLARVFHDPEQWNVIHADLRTYLPFSVAYALKPVMRA